MGENHETEGRTKWNTPFTEERALDKNDDLQEVKRFRKELTLGEGGFPRTGKGGEVEKRVSRG